MQRTEGLDDHERLKELCALVQTNSLDMTERLDLERHLEICGECRKICDQYAAIGADGMAFLSQDYVFTEAVERWDNHAARERLLSTISSSKSHKVLSIKTGLPARRPRLAHFIASRELAIGSLAASLIIGVGLGVLLIGQRKDVASPTSTMNLVQSHPTAAAAKQASGDLLELQNRQIARLEQQISRQDLELTRLKMGASLADARVNELEDQKKGSEASLRQLTEERDKLAGRFDEIDGAYQKLQTDFTALKSEYSHSMLHTASLESQVSSMTAINREQDRKMKDDEQYLVSDRDIRELMGARKLYIADVFDVDSASRTRKPFGRVFYTQNKSLVFYAFDLDHQTGVKNASDFQVWGQRDSEPNGNSHPMNLGILYLDSETNRRWVLRSDDPRQLAEIDAVFVTVEPHGGSQKPSGKPLLYALLRKEANHP